MKEKEMYPKKLYAMRIKTSDGAVWYNTLADPATFEEEGTVAVYQLVEQKKLKFAAILE